MTRYALTARHRTTLWDALSDTWVGSKILGAVAGLLLVVGAAVYRVVEYFTSPEHEVELAVLQVSLLLLFFASGAVALYGKSLF